MTSEKEKMLAGLFYNPNDAELSMERDRVRELFRQYNSVAYTDKTLARELLKQIFATGGDTVVIEPPFFCDYGSNITLGKQVYFNFNCVILDVCQVTIGDHCFFAPNVQLFTATHPIDPELRRITESGAPITIGNDVWIGGNTVVCPGVSIGDGSVIGAGSVVTRDIPAGVVAVGNPCRVLREITDEDRRPPPGH